MTERLSDFEFRAASVLSYTVWPNSPHKYFLLGREARGSNIGTWDAFGGLRDEGESHPVVTAARELAEETMYLIFPTDEDAINYITLASGHTSNIIANREKRGVVYITHIDHQLLRSLRKNFYTTREKLLKKKGTGHLTEKDGIAFVREDRLASAIAGAQRSDTGKLVLPILVDATLPLGSNGELSREKIELRPVLVNLLQSFFKGDTNYEVGRDPRIMFYQR